LPTCNCVSSPTHRTKRDEFFLRSNRSSRHKEMKPHTHVLAPCHVECDIYFFLYSNSCSVFFFSCFAVMFVCVSSGHAKRSVVIYDNLFLAFNRFYKSVSAISSHYFFIPNLVFFYALRMASICNSLNTTTHQNVTFLSAVPHTKQLAWFSFLSTKGKGKAFPLQPSSGPEGSRKLRFPDFMTTAQNGGKVVSITHRPPLPPRNTLGTHFR
jgi:hypothetical protein